MGHVCLFPAQGSSSLFCLSVTPAPSPGPGTEGVAVDIDFGTWGIQGEQGWMGVRENVEAEAKRPGLIKLG